MANEQYKGKLLISGKDIIDSIDDSTDGGVNNITANGTNIKVSKKDGSSSNVATSSTIPNVNSGTLKVGPTGNVSYTFPSGKTAASTSFTVPYFTVDAQGRVTSATNRTITVARAAYSNYGSYASYSSYGRYSRYGNYSNND